MTQKDMMAKIRDLGGMSVRVRDGEIRVNHKGGKEETAYYTNDREDAVATAEHMRRSQQGFTIPSAKDDSPACETPQSDV